MLTQLLPEHADAVVEISQACYSNPKYWTTRNEFLTKFHNYSPGCVGWTEDNKLVAYLEFFPWIKCRPYPFEREECWIVGLPTVMYCHDLCILPEYRKKGIAQALLNVFEEQAREAGLKVGVGVACQGTWFVWPKYGWVPVERVDYGPEEAWMILKFLS